MTHTIQVNAILFVVLSCSWAHGQQTDSVSEPLKGVQGNWVCAHMVGGLLNDQPDELIQLIQAIGTEGGSLTVHGTNLLSDKEQALATLADAQHLPLSLPLVSQLQKQFDDLEERFGHKTRLLVLTAPSGQSVLISAATCDDVLEIRSPAGCCSRSGAVIHFTRAK
ncbi:MAG: hypothetical protein KDA66_07860 [Planctomycetaceae bacterium]|nr:hypothetical protein [Planctomycetaceae bacterium]